MWLLLQWRLACVVWRASHLETRAGKELLQNLPLLCHQGIVRAFRLEISGWPRLFRTVWPWTVTRKPWTCS